MWRLVIAVYTLALFAGNSLADGISAAMDQYLRNPTNENAVRTIKYAEASREAVWLTSNDLMIIRNQIVSGGAASLRLVFAMIPSADGGNLEDLMALAAASIRPQPRQFLEEVQRAKLRDSTLESILLMPGQEYVDRAEAKAFELAMRQRAINSVVRRELLTVRDRCARVLYLSRVK